MMFNTLLTAFLLLISAQGFAPVRQLTRSLPLLHSSMSVEDYDNHYRAVLSQADDCSRSDTCPVEQAEWYMSELMTFQQECSVGSLDDDVCENPEALYQLIHQLQDKIINHKHSNVRVADNGGSSLSMPSAVVMAAVLMIVTAKVMTTNFGGDNTVAFTAEEWWWAFRDNYFPLMVVHFIRDGGLIVTDM
jgi:hypothetical protein